MSFNPFVIDAIRDLPDYGQPNGLPRPVALWPCNAFAFDGKADREVLARKLGFLPMRLGWFVANPALAAEHVEIAKATGARLWLLTSPYESVYGAVKATKTESFTCEGRTFTFRCGDPRLWLPAHHDWIERFNSECLAAGAAIRSANVAAVIHFDFECWSASDGQMETLPPALAHAIRSRAWLVSDIARQHLPNALQEWNDWLGVRDVGLAGWQHSPMYPRPVESMPGDVVHTTMFLAGEPHYWEEVARRTLPLLGSARPWVWNIALGLTPRVNPNWSMPAPIMQTYPPPHSLGYHPERSHLLGGLVAGRRGGDRWKWCQRISWLSIESSILEPGMAQWVDAAGQWPLEQHWRAFIAGMLGKPYG